MKVKNWENRSSKENSNNSHQKIHIRHNGLLHGNLPYIINHHAHLSYLFNISTEWLHQLLLFRDPLTLSEHQGHSNKSQTVEFSCV